MLPAHGFRGTQQRGDLRVRPALKIEQKYCLALFGGERFQGPGEPLPLICLLGLGIGRCTRRGFYPGKRSGFPPSAERVERVSVDRPRQPCSEPLRLTAFPESAPYPEQRVLADVLGQVGVAHNAARHGEGRSGMACNEHPERSVVAVPGGSEQRGI